MKLIYSGLLVMSFLWGVAPSTFAAEPPSITFATGFDSGSILHRRFQLLYSDAFRRLGLAFKMISLPKDQALLQANLGIVDGDTSRVIELENHPDYRNLIRVDVMTYRSYQVAFATNRRLKVVNWEDIKAQNLSIAYPRGQIYNMTKARDLQLPSHKALLGKDCVELLEWLQSGRVDLYLDNLTNCWDVRRSERYRSVQVASILGEDHNFPYIHKKHKDLVPRLTAALKASLADPAIHAQLALLERENLGRHSHVIEVELYTPYDFEPFIVDRALKQGLIYDFQRLLNALGDGLYHFQLQTAPRIPVERLLKMRKIAIVPFVTQPWFNDEAGTLFDWTLALNHDVNVIVSSRANPLNSLEPADLKGKTLCASSGLRRDKHLQKLIDDGTIKQTLTPNIAHCLLMVAHRRADFYVSGFMLVDYFLKRMDLGQHLHVSAPVRSFTRHILVSPKGTELLGWLNQRIEGLEKNEIWQKILKSYQDTQ